MVVFRSRESTLRLTIHSAIPGGMRGVLKGRGQWSDEATAVTFSEVSMRVTHRITMQHIC